MSVSLDIEIPRDARAPSTARRAVEELDTSIDPTVVPEVQLLVSELITNGVKYGGEGSVRLKVDVASPTRLRVDVIDQGGGFVPVARNRPATEVGGWGLHLVKVLSSRWGVSKGSTVVWFEIDRDQRQPAESGGGGPALLDVPFAVSDRERDRARPHPQGGPLIA